MIDKTITKFYEDSFPNSKGIVEWWGGFESEQVGEREYKYYGLDNMQTLCRPCHREKTNQDIKKRT